MKYIAKYAYKYAWVVVKLGESRADTRGAKVGSCDGAETEATANGMVVGGCDAVVGTCICEEVNAVVEFDGSANAHGWDGDVSFIKEKRTAHFESECDVCHRSCQLKKTCVASRFVVAVAMVEKAVAVAGMVETIVTADIDVFYNPIIFMKIRLAFLWWRRQC